MAGILMSKSIFRDADGWVHLCSDCGLPMLPDEFAKRVINDKYEVIHPQCAQEGKEEFVSHRFGLCRSIEILESMGHK